MADTVMLVGSVPDASHGVIDPIEELGQIARQYSLWLHVDACIGGYLAPFARTFGYPVPPFDFAVPGMTSISADLHKYGYVTVKCASVILYSDLSWFRHQMFHFNEWPRGKFSAATFSGSRPGGAIAAAWAVMRYLGHEGYRKIAKIVMQARDDMMHGIRANRWAANLG